MKIGQVQSPLSNYFDYDFMCEVSTHATDQARGIERAFTLFLRHKRELKVENGVNGTTGRIRPGFQSNRGK